MYYLIIVGVFAVDRITKIAVTAAMSPHESINVISGLFSITYIRNTGAAFSIFSSHTGMLAAVTAVLAVAGLVFIAKKRDGNRLMLVSVAMIIGGGIGNLFDRMVHGYVVDMFDLRWFAVFNAADVFVVTGCILLCIYVLFWDKDNGRKQKI